jgi:hypothetical protein
MEPVVPPPRPCPSRVLAIDGVGYIIEADPSGARAVSILRDADEFRESISDGSRSWPVTRFDIGEIPHSLQHISIPRSVVVIAVPAFAGCHWLRSIDLATGGSAPRKQAPRMPGTVIGVDLEDRAEAAESCARSGPVQGHIIMLINETMSSLSLFHLMPFQEARSLIQFWMAWQPCRQMSFVFRECLRRSSSFGPLISQQPRLGASLPLFEGGFRFLGIEFP